MAEAAASPVRSEELLNRKTDLCISNLIVKATFGFSIGVVSSVLLFRRRIFPLWFFTGAGVGAAYSDCQIAFNPAAVPGYRIAGSATPVAATLAAPQPAKEV